MAWVLLSIAGLLVLLTAVIVALLVWGYPRWGEGWRSGGFTPPSFRCPGCHRKIPDSAKQCPNCGCPFDT
jgi:hypothetical protein